DHRIHRKESLASGDGASVVTRSGSSTASSTLSPRRTRLSTADPIPDDLSLGSRIPLVARLTLLGHNRFRIERFELPKCAQALPAVSVLNEGLAVIQKLSPVSTISSRGTKSDICGAVWPGWCMS